MKFSSLITTLSCAGIMAVCSLNANAETTNDSTTDKAELTEQELTTPLNYKNKEKSAGYSVYSFAKDKQITLNNMQQQEELENIEWYIEKF